MKRMLALALALAAVLTLAGCGGGKTASEAETSDLAYVQDKGYLTVGVTDYPPMDYQDANGNWIGFDADLARAFAKRLGVDAVFVEINWDRKHQDLQDKTIDMVWNGMTLNDTVAQQMAVSVPYCRNAQVVVVPTYMVSACRTEDDLKNLNFVVEEGSAGAEALGDIGIVHTTIGSQSEALARVAEGSFDACVLDQIMALATTGADTDHPNLSMAMELAPGRAEELVTGFRMDSDLVDAFNQFWTEACADGTVDATAEAYSMTDFVLKP